ncbi:MAG: threonine/serine dehydratase [Desulfobacteraceae bacterium]|nr:threonine/serine dehydratase [Desulfobacteraceae bacterium]
MDLVGKITNASKRIRPQVRYTPLEYSMALSRICGAEVHLKCEHLQETGSFKFRGATHKILSLTDEQRQQGVITASTGNHGLAVATACRRLRMNATIFTPETASPAKLDHIEKLGAILTKVPGDCLNAELTARKTAESQGITFISPYNDIDVIAGQGTVGLEMFEQCPDLETVFVSVGGGGLISGISVFLKAMNPDIRIVGCWPENSAAMYESIKASRIVDAPEHPTISDGTAGPVEPGSITYPLCAEHIDRHVLVSEQKIYAAMGLLAEHERWIVEGAAGVALAALLKHPDAYKGGKAGVVLCGRNIVLEKFLSVISTPQAVQTP